MGRRQFTYNKSGKRGKDCLCLILSLLELRKEAAEEIRKFERVYGKK